MCQIKGYQETNNICIKHIRYHSDIITSLANTGNSPSQFSRRRVAVELFTSFWQCNKLFKYAYSQTMTQSVNNLHVKLKTKEAYDSTIVKLHWMQHIFAMYNSITRWCLRNKFSFQERMPRPFCIDCENNQLLNLFHTIY